MSATVVLFTDFGAGDIYVGQMKAAMLAAAPRLTLIDLLHDAPAFDVEAAAHLLSACSRHFPADSVFLAVVDPGVGGTRDPVVVKADDAWFVGPDNGLLSVVAARASAVEVHSITWRPAELSASFHGRDLFGPLAARLAAHAVPQTCLRPKLRLDCSFSADDRHHVIYVDHYGNVMTGIRASGIGPDAKLHAGSVVLSGARTFGDVPADTCFWYANSIGLVEIAANRGQAARQLRLHIGDPVRFVP